MKDDKFIHHSFVHYKALLNIYSDPDPVIGNYQFRHRGFYKITVVQYQRLVYTKSLLLTL